MLPVMSSRIGPGPGSPGLMAWSSPSWRYQERMTNRSSRAWVRTKNIGGPAVRLSRTIDSDPPSAACRVTASG
jgi:hypothetical protein